MGNKYDLEHYEEYKLINGIGIKRIMLCVEACKGITDKFLEEGLVEFAITNPALFANDYDIENMTYDGMEIWDD